MANVGLSNIWWSPLTEGADGTPTYAGARTMGKAVSCSTSISNNSANLYGDDMIAESDTSYASGTITIGVTDDDDTIFAPLLGHTLTDGEIIKKSEDNAPYIGCGRIIMKMVNGAYKYKVEFLPKVKFSEPSQDNTTKGESIEFSTPSIEGTILTLKDGTWNRSKTFDTKSEALLYLKGLLADATSTFRVTYDANGGTCTTEGETVAVGESVTLPISSTVTPPSNKEFVGWATSPTATSANVESPYYPTDDITLYAVYADE